MSLAVIIPAFNEAAKIGSLLGDMPAQVFGHDVVTVVVDDGSTDGTGGVALGHGPTVLKQTPNQGKGAALCRGLEYIDGLDAVGVVWMDGDGQHLPESIPALVAPVLQKDIDLSVGSRYIVAHQGTSAPLNRRLVRRATIRAVERITGLNVTDPFSGFRCFSRRAVDVLQLDGCGYESELESTFAVARAGLSYTEIPVPRIYGPDTSKMAHRGRMQVVSGYAKTIRQARRQAAGKREVQLVA